jgi:hypothetical protein
MTEKIKDAMKDERRTSDTPYCRVDSIKCKENALRGSTLYNEVINILGRTPGRYQRGKKGYDDDDEDDNTYFAKKTSAVAGSTL